MSGEREKEEDRNVEQKEEGGRLCWKNMGDEEMDEERREKARGRRKREKEWEREEREKERGVDGKRGGDRER